ncbi:MAG: phosphomannomutase/phosphoglucomutase [Clostridia bacterium]
MSIYKDCDIRGVFGRELFARDGHDVGRALAALRPGGVFRVGGDVRLSTPELKAALIEGLVEGGANVQDMGTIATPVLYWALKRPGADGGVMVTASHNPAQYNGLKFMLGNQPVTRALIDRIEALVARGAFPEGAGRLEALDVLPGYLGAMKARFGCAPRGKVVVDAGNGAMSLIAPEALRACGYQVVELFCTPDGAFPNRAPNPAEYGELTALKALVVKERAAFGVAFDGDGDRAVFVDELGEVVVSERALVVFIRHLLSGKPAPVVYDQKSSSVVKDAIRQMGGTPVAERSGHTFIKRRFLALGAALAGEVSGHFFFGELGYDDGLFAALLMGEALSKAGTTLSQALLNVVCPPITPDLRVFCAYARQDALLGEVAQAFEGHPITRMDGVRVETADGWLLVRKSVTAEQVTVRVEGRTFEALNELLKRVAAAAPELEALSKA